MKNTDHRVPGSDWVPMVYASGVYNGEGVEVAEHTEEAVWFRYHNSEHTFPVTPSEWPHLAYAIDFPAGVYGPRYARYTESFEITEI